MSFSSEVKNELLGELPGARHCRLAEMKALYRGLEGRMAEGRIELKRTPAGASGKFFTLLEKTYNIEGEKGAYRPKELAAAEDAVRAIEDTALNRSCCRRSYLRGMFLCTGSVSDPSKAYQLEFALKDAAIGERVMELLKEEGLGARRAVRGGRTVVYLRDGEEISGLLGYMGASVSLLKMENERVLRDVRGNINRRVNLETANIGKAVDAAARQTEAIKYLESEGLLGELPESLKEIAAARLSSPEATLEELGEMLDKPLGKSGVNHRLRRLMEAAAEKGFCLEEECL